MRSAREGDELRTGTNMRALLSAIASGKEEIERIGRKHGWSVGIREEMLDRLQAMVREPMQRGSDIIMSSIPLEWREQATERVSKADSVIRKITCDTTTEDWSLQHCQDYLVDLEMSLAGVATALEVSAPGQLRDEQVGTYRELEQKIGIARGLANKLRARHLEAYDQQGGPVAYADTSGIWKRLMMARVRLDEKLAACLPPDHAERSTRMLLGSMKQEEDKEKPSALPPSPPRQRDDSEGAWPWFSGNIEDLAWFRQAWEMHVRRFHHGLAPEVLVGGMRKYCVPRGIGRMIEPARDPEEVWQIMESYFNRETRMLDQSI
jgi:hypothetical protein